MHWPIALPAARNARELRLTHEQRVSRTLRATPFMKPPADRRLDLNGTGVDLPAPPRPRYGLSSRVVLAVAGLLSALTSILAAQAAAQGGRFDGMASAGRPQLQLLVHLGAAYSSGGVALAAFQVRAARPAHRAARTPASRGAVLARSPRGDDRRALVARDGGRSHVRLGGGVRACDAHESRGGDDHLLGDRGGESGGPLLSRDA